MKEKKTDSCLRPAYVENLSIRTNRPPLAGTHAAEREANRCLSGLQLNKKGRISLRLKIYQQQKFSLRNLLALGKLRLEGIGLYEETIPIDRMRLRIRQGQLTFRFWTSASPPSSPPSSSLDSPTEVAEMLEFVLHRGAFFAPRLLSFFKAFFHFRLCSSSSWT